MNDIYREKIFLVKKTSTTNCSGVYLIKEQKYI